MNFLNNKKIQQVLLAGLTYTPLEPLPGEKLSNGVYAGNFSQLIGVFFNVLLSIGAMIAVITLVLGGITYMVSEIVDKKTEARKRMQTAIMGLLLLLTSWLILHEINPNLTQFNLQLTNSSYGGATGNSTVFIKDSSGTALGNFGDIQMGSPPTMSALQGVAVRSALNCGQITDVTCFGSSEYITYDPAYQDVPQVQQAISTYKLRCEGLPNGFIGNVKPVDGGLLGAPGQTGLVCAGPGR